MIDTCHTANKTPLELVITGCDIWSLSISRDQSQRLCSFSLYFKELFLWMLAAWSSSLLKLLKWHLWLICDKIRDFYLFIILVSWIFYFWIDLLSLYLFIDQFHDLSQVSLCLVVESLQDPCRPGVKDAVKVCMDAGVKVGSWFL